jgi:hypothetical protein
MRKPGSQRMQIPKPINSTSNQSLNGFAARPTCSDRPQRSPRSRTTPNRPNMEQRSTTDVKVVASRSSRRTLRWTTGRMRGVFTLIGPDSCSERLRRSKPLQRRSVGARALKRRRYIESLRRWNSFPRACWWIGIVRDRGSLLRNRGERADEAGLGDGDCCVRAR